MLLNQNWHASEDLAREARILALESVPTKHAIPTTKAAKQQHTCTNGKEHKSGGSKLYQLLIEVQNTIKNVAYGTCKAA
jgi:hypothetical protein